MQRIIFETIPYEINGWLVAPLPAEASAALPSRGQVMAEGTIAGYDFIAPLEPDGRGGHWLQIDATMQRAGVERGQSMPVSIQIAAIWPEPNIPKDVSSALAQDAAASKSWQATTPMARWEWLRWINSTKEPVTRARRITVSCSKLARGERRPCCFNRAMCCVPDVSKNGQLLLPEATQ